MPDEEGNTLPGELGGGAYGAIEGDLGFKLHPLAGFGRELSEPEMWPGVVFTVQQNFQTSPGILSFVVARPEWEML